MKLFGIFTLDWSFEKKEPLRQIRENEKCVLLGKVQGLDICPGCMNLVDPDTCHCGGGMRQHDLLSNHSPVAIGCVCYVHHCSSDPTAPAYFSDPKALLDLITFAGMDTGKLVKNLRKVVRRVPTCEHFTKADACVFAQPAQWAEAAGITLGLWKLGQ